MVLWRWLERHIKTKTLFLLKNLILKQTVNIFMYQTQLNNSKWLIFLVFTLLYFTT